MIPTFDDICIIQLQRNGFGELVSPRGSTHGNPESKWVTTELLFRCARCGCDGGWDGDRDCGTALIATGRVNCDAFDALSVSRRLPCHARSALITGLSVEERLYEIVLLQ